MLIEEPRGAPGMMDQRGAAPAAGRAATGRAAQPGSDLAAQVAGVIAFWSELGLSGLIDVHTHFMPANVMKKVWAYFDNVGAERGQQWPIG